MGEKVAEFRVQFCKFKSLPLLGLLVRLYGNDNEHELGVGQPLKNEVTFKKNFNFSPFFEK